MSIGYRLSQTRITDYDLIGRLWSAVCSVHSAFRIGNDSNDSYTLTCAWPFAADQDCIKSVVEQRNVWQLQLTD